MGDKDGVGKCNHTGSRLLRRTPLLIGGGSFEEWWCRWCGSMGVAISGEYVKWLLPDGSEAKERLEKMDKERDEKDA